MKKFILAVVATIILLNFLPISSAKAEEGKIYYAKIPAYGVNFCELPSESSALFELPFSYFVKVNGVVDDYFSITYRDISGYVKKNKVNLVDGQPTKPFDNTVFNVYLPFSMYQSTNQNSSIALLTPSMPLNFYGKKSGEQMKPGIDDWYYSSTTVDGQTVRGYVYSDHAPAQIQIEENHENFPSLSESVLFPSSSSFGGLSTGTKIILIVAISVPSVLILYFLIKPSKIMQITKTKRKPKNQPKRLRHGDYFEFDESEL